MAVPKEIGHEPWSEVPSQVDGEGCLPPETGRDSEDDEEDAEWNQIPGAEVAVVLERVDAEHEDGARDELGEELAGFGEEGGWVGAEDPRGGCVGSEAGDGADVATAFVDVDGGFVVAVHDAGSTHGAQHLGEHINGKFAPGKPAEDTVCEGDSRIDVGTRYAGDIDAEHDSKAEMVCEYELVFCLWRQRMGSCEYGCALLTQIPMLWIDNHLSCRR